MPPPPRLAAPRLLLARVPAPFPTPPNASALRERLDEPRFWLPKSRDWPPMSRLCPARSRDWPPRSRFWPPTSRLDPSRVPLLTRFPCVSRTFPAPSRLICCRPCSARPRNASRDCTASRLLAPPYFWRLFASRYSTPLRLAALCCHLLLPALLPARLLLPA